MSRPAPRTLTIALLLAACLGLGACASTPRSPEDEFAGPNDPLESVNRPVFAFNKALDDYALKPVAKGYRTVLPEPVRDGVRRSSSPTTRCRGTASAPGRPSRGSG
jgi:phospholipid-binding lipoprotein MlaA